MDTDSPHMFTSNCIVKEKFKKKLKNHPFSLLLRLNTKCIFMLAG